jgi:hypothetical protein
LSLRRFSWLWLTLLAAGCDNPDSPGFLTPLERLPVGAFFVGELRVVDGFREAMVQVPIEGFREQTTYFDNGSIEQGTKCFVATYDATFL